MQSSPASRHFLPLRSKYSPQRPVLKHLQSELRLYFNLYFLKQETVRQKVLFSWVVLPHFKSPGEFTFVHGRTTWGSGEWGIPCGKIKTCLYTECIRINQLTIRRYTSAACSSWRIE
jgi:hypothetical protein